MSLFEELKRRRVIRLIAAYLVVAWLLVQVVTAIEEPLNLPDWFDTAVIVLLGLGFPIAVIMSWVYDVTPEGVVREDGTTARPVSVDYGKIALGAVIVLGAFLAGIYITNGNRIQAPVERALLNGPQIFEIGLQGLAESQPRDSISMAIAPDGQTIYVAMGLDGEERLLSRRMGRLSFLPIDGATGFRGQFTISPDGRSAVYQGPGLSSISRISTSGGIPIEISDELESPLDLTSGVDGSIVFKQGQTSGLLKISSVGGPVEQISFPDNGLNHKHPSFVPGTDALVFAVGERGYSFDRNDRIGVMTGDGDIRMLGIVGASPKVSADGHLVYFSHGALWAVDFDLDALEVIGEPVPIVDDVLYIHFARFDLSDEGTLLYRRDSVRGLQSLVWVDRDGREKSTGIGGALFNSPKISPDGDKVAVTVDSADSLDLWTYSLDRGTPTRLTDDEVRETSVVWSPDGKYVYFESGPTIDMRRVGNDGQIETLDSSRVGHWPFSFTPDGRLLFVSLSGDDERGRFDILQYDTIDGSFSSVLRTEYWESHPAISPDGKWLAYMSNRSGEQEIYVRPYPEVGTGGVQVSVGGGWLAEWNADGNELYYWGDSSVMSVPIDTSAGFSAGDPVPLFDNDPYYFDAIGSYDFDPVREQFLMIKKPLPGSTRDQLVLIQNWPALMEPAGQ